MVAGYGLRVTSLPSVLNLLCFCLLSSDAPSTAPYYLLPTVVPASDLWPLGFCSPASVRRLLSPGNPFEHNVADGIRQDIRIDFSVKSNAGQAYLFDTAQDDLAG